MLTRQFKKKIELWARERRSIRAIGVVGSHARGTAKPDSDIDLIVVDDNFSKLTENTSWAVRFGEIRSINKEDYSLVQSVRVFYGCGREVEFGITGMEWCTLPLDSQTACVIKDGLSILYDPDKLLICAKNWVKAHYKS